MRIVPLLPSDSDPGAWQGGGDAELAWTGTLHAGWEPAVRRGFAVHAVHLPEKPWGDKLVEAALAPLRHGLGLDFLVVPAPKPDGRREGYRFLGAVEALLEAIHPRGLKLALKPGPGATATLVDLLKQSRGEAVGFCWHPGVEDLEAMSDRLFCATLDGADPAAADLGPLRRLGFRWNLALRTADPAGFAADRAALEARFPGVLFPAQMPTHALGRPVLPDEGVTFGRPFDARGAQ